MQAAPTSSKVLYITAREAKELKKVQLLGRQDPYLKLWVGQGGTRKKTAVHDDGSSRATWGETFRFDLESINPAESLYFEVKNKNLTDSKSIGMSKVPIKTFGEAAKEMWHPIYDVRGKQAGQVLLSGRIERRNDNDRAIGIVGRNHFRMSTQGVQLPANTASASAHDRPQSTNSWRQQPSFSGGGYGQAKTAGSPYQPVISSSAFTLNRGPSGHVNIPYTPAPSAATHHNRHHSSPYSQNMPAYTTSGASRSSTHYNQLPHSPTAPVNHTYYLNNNDIINGAPARPPTTTNRNAVYYGDTPSASQYTAAPAAASSSPHGFSVPIGGGTGGAAPRFAGGGGGGVAAGVPGSFRGSASNVGPAYLPPPDSSPRQGLYPYGNSFTVNGGHGTHASSLPSAPTAPSAPSAPSAGESYNYIPPLPPSRWEERVTPEGRTYYLDHSTRTTSWVPPTV